MSYVNLFAAASSHHTSFSGTEIEFADAVGAMNLDVQMIDNESNSLDLTLAKLAEIENFTAVMEHNGQPKTEAEKLMLNFSALALFGGSVPFEDITEGYSVESIASDADAFGYSIESFKRRAQSIWDWIKAQVKRIWGYIDRFFYNLIGGIPNLRKKATALRERASAAQGKVKEENSFEVDGNTVASLADYDGKLISDARPIIDNLSGGASIIGDGEKFYYNKLEKLGNAINDPISSASPEDTAYLETINTAVTTSDAYNAIATDKLFTKHKMKNKTGNDKRFTGRSVRELGLFAGKTIFQVSGSALPAASALGEAEQIRSIRVELRETSSDIKKPKSGKMNVWELAECESLADAIELFCDAAESVQRGAEKGSISKAAAKLDKTGDKFGKQLAAARKRTGDDALTPDALSSARSALSYVKYYGELAAKPLPQIIALYAAGFNAALSVANKSISMYK